MYAIRSYYEKEMYGLSFDAKDSGNIDNLQKELPYIIEKFMNESKLGNKMVAKWFNRSANVITSYSIHYTKLYDAMVADAPRFFEVAKKVVELTP